MLAVLLITVLSCVILWRMLVGTRASRLIDKIPGPRALPIVGNLRDAIATIDEMIPMALERGKEFGPIYRIWSFHIPIVVVCSAEHMEVILSHNQEIQKSFMYGMLKDWLGLGLLTSKGPRWLKHRKMITPTFHFKILDSFIPIFESNCQVLTEKITKQIESNNVFDIYPFITLCALDIICETAMGTNMHAQNNKSSDYIDALYELAKLLSERFGRAYLHHPLIYGLTSSGRKFAKSLKVLHDFTTKVIRERKELRKNENTASDESDEGVKKKKAFLDLLLDAGGDLTETDIREEVDTFMFEGHDTTTVGINWTLYLLGRHPNIQEQVAEEVRTHWPEGEPLTMQALNDMKLLERVIKESLRVYPSVPFVSRQLQKDLKFGDYIVPANTTVSIGIAILHNDEKVFPEPRKFDPDRFLPENVQKRHPYAFVPFSAGPRNCIGQKFAILEEKAVLASVVRAFKFEALEKEEDIIGSSVLVQRPKNGIKLRMEKRI